jgi:hypothetical protein
MDEKRTIEVLHFILSQISNKEEGKFRLINYLFEDILKWESIQIFDSNFEKFYKKFFDRDCIEDLNYNWELYCMMMKILVEYFSEEIQASSEKEEICKNFKIFQQKMENKLDSESSKVMLTFMENIFK